MLTPEQGEDLPPDWYPDLDDAVERYWDGTAWTDVRELGGDVAMGELIRSQRRTERSTNTIRTILIIAGVLLLAALVFGALASTIK